MCEAADYCRHIDLLVIACTALIYGAGVVIAVHVEKRKGRKS